MTVDAIHLIRGSMCESKGQYAVLPSHLVPRRQRGRGMGEGERKRARQRERCRQRRGAMRSVISAQYSDSQGGETNQARVNGASNMTPLR